MRFVMLYRYEYVDNGIGLYKNAWFLTEEEANLSRADKLMCGYFAPDDPCGLDGELTTVESLAVEMTPEGILDFVRLHANAADE